MSHGLSFRCRKVPTIFPRAFDHDVVGNAEAEIHVELRVRHHVRHQHLVMVHAERRRPAVHVLLGVHPRHGRHGGAQLDRRAGRIVEVQRATLMRHLDERRSDADRVEIRLRLVEVFVHEHAEADALAHRLPVGALQRETVMAPLLDAAQPQRVRRLVGDDQPDHLGVEVAARGEVARGEREMARPRDVERREEVGLRQFHVRTLVGLLSGGGGPNRWSFARPIPSRPPAFGNDLRYPANS